MAATVSSIRSIQGERQQAIQTTLWADDDAVDAYVRSADDGTIDCREQGHNFISARRQGKVIFTGQDTAGNMERRVKCSGCGGLCVRVEKWTSTGRGRHLRWWMLSSHLEYPVVNGKKYTAPAGTGRMRRRSIQSACVTMAFEGMTLKEIQALTPGND